MVIVHLISRCWNSEIVFFWLVLILDFAGVIDALAALISLILFFKNPNPKTERKWALIALWTSLFAGILWTADALANHRFSALQQIAAEEQSAQQEAKLKEFEAQTKPRRLTGTNRVAFANLLSNSPWGIVIVSVLSDGESEDFGDDLNLAFHEANWRTRRWSNFTGNWSGVSIGMLEGSIDAGQTNRIRLVVNALNAIGIPSEKKTIGESYRQRMSPWFETNVLYLVIGHKPVKTLDNKSNK